MDELQPDSLVETLKKTAEPVVIEGCSEGLGIRIVGGRNLQLADGEESDFGIFVKEIIPGRLADRDGRLAKGDQIVEANGVSLVGVSNFQAVQVLKEGAGTDRLELLIARDARSKSDFRRLSAATELHNKIRVTMNDGGTSEPLSGPPIASSTPAKVPEITPTSSSPNYHDNRAIRNLEATPPPVLTVSPANDDFVMPIITTVTKTDAGPTQRSSMASDFTDITTTDISSNEERDGEGGHTEKGEGGKNVEKEEREERGGRIEIDPGLPLPLPMNDEREAAPDASSTRGVEGLKSEKAVALSDVIVSVASSTALDHPSPLTTTATLLENGQLDSEDESPPPPPPPSTLPPEHKVQEDEEGGSNEPPSLSSLSPPPIPSSPMPDETEEHIQPTLSEPNHTVVAVRTTSGYLSHRSPGGNLAGSSPLSLLPSYSSPSSSTISTITITKNTGLGVIITGGGGHLYGPHIWIEKISENMDAAKDGRLKVGDKILSVNGESFVNISRERALTILLQQKTRPAVKSYTITYERPALVSEYNEGGSLDPSPPPTLPQRSTTPSSIFDSDTLPASVAKTTMTTDIPPVYYQHSMGEGRAADNRLGEGEIRGGRTGGGGGGGGGGGMRGVTPRRYLAKKEQGDKTKYDSLHKRLSMDPTAKVSLSKLEWALNYMGYTFTPSQKEKVHSTLDVDKSGKVIFSEFVLLAQEMFSFKMEDAHLEAGLVFALTQKDSLDLPAFPRKATSLDQLWREYSPSPSHLTKLTSSQPIVNNYTSSSSISSHPTYQYTPTAVSGEADLAKLRQQLHKIGEKQDQRRRKEGEEEIQIQAGGGGGTEASHLKESYLGTVSDTLLMRGFQSIAPEEGTMMGAKFTGEELKELNEVQILRKRVEVLEADLREKQRELDLLYEVQPGVSREAQALRRKVRESEEELEASRRKNSQLEETARHMEAELAALRRRPAERDMHTVDQQRRLATLDCQLKKEQAITRRFQVTTEKLMQFVENCHEALVKTPEARNILYHRHGKGESVQRGDAVTGNPRPPPYLSQHARVTSVSLAQEAQETLLAVRKMLQIRALPYGWEEACTEEGEKYYINHEIQTTSWVHPVTHVAVATTPPSATPSRQSSRHSSRSSSHHRLPPPPPIQAQALDTPTHPA